MADGYYAYMGQGAGPRIVVIQDLDDIRGHGSFWGEVNSNLHKGLGALGVTTDGSVRDLPDLAENFQVLAGSILPSHAYVHVVDFGGEVHVSGMRVRDGDRRGTLTDPFGHVWLLASKLEDVSSEELRRRFEQAMRAGEGEGESEAT